jgi:hypothetical protein
MGAGQPAGSWIGGPAHTAGVECMPHAVLQTALASRAVRRQILKEHTMIPPNAFMQADSMAKFWQSQHRPLLVSQLGKITTAQPPGGVRHYDQRTL